MVLKTAAALATEPTLPAVRRLLSYSVTLGSHLLRFGASLSPPPPARIISPIRQRTGLISPLLVVRSEKRRTSGFERAPV